MSKEQNLIGAQLIAPSLSLVVSGAEGAITDAINRVPTCAEGHCITCSDEAVQVRVLSIDCDTGVALVESGESTEEVDISLVEEVVPGDMLLVHGGVAIASFKEGE
jgi:hydrogenase maturation factor